MEALNSVQTFAVWVLPVLFAITVHEVAHGWAAMKLGDPTAKMLGRLTLNPVKHIDPIGTLLVPGFLTFVGGFIFGWAKPIPVNTRNLKDQKWSPVWIALSGPAAMLLISTLSLAAFLGLGAVEEGSPAIAFHRLFQNMIQLSAFLAFFHFLPLYPLAGGVLLSTLLPYEMRQKYEAIVIPYGTLIIIGLMLVGAFRYLGYLASFWIGLSNLLLSPFFN